MSPQARNRYFGQFWPAACAAKRWSVKDEVRRRHTTGECMREVRGPETESTSDLGPDEITALFTYLTFLARPDDLKASAAWVDCKTDYRAFNRARQADWHQEKAYGGRGKKLMRDRFGGASSAQGEPFEKFDPAAIRKRHITMASRHRKKAKKQLPGDLRFIATIAGRVVTGPEPAPNENPF